MPWYQIGPVYTGASLDGAWEGLKGDAELLAHLGKALFQFDNIVRSSTLVFA